MPQPPDDPVLSVFVYGTMLLSVVVGIYLIAKSRRGPLLVFQPRKPVPWCEIALLLPALFVVFALLSPFQGREETEPHKKAASNQAAPQVDVPSSHAATQILASIVPELLLVGGVLFLVAVYYEASRCDLGLPESGSEFTRDVFIGIVAGIAALAPIYILQGLLASLMNIQEPSEHPLVKLIMNGKPDVTVMLLAGFTAVVVAPICEEITFRLLLQGWLEKWDIKRLRWRSEPAEPLMSNDEAQMTNDEGILPDDSPCDIRHVTLSSPPARGIGGWPFSWFPITISAVLFGLAHFGYGPEPIPLFFLGLILGYLYQRTHRIVPSIVAHAIFNLFTMIVLWRMVFYNAQ